MTENLRNVSAVHKRAEKYIRELVELGFSMSIAHKYARRRFGNECLSR